MIPALLMLAAQALPAPPAPQLAAPALLQTRPAAGGGDAQPVAPVKSRIDWEALPPLPYRAPPHLSEPMMRFAANEVASKRCAAVADAEGRFAMPLDVAVLVDGEGRVVRTVPRAIQCSTVEQYGAGLVSTFARNNLLPRGGATGRWYRATLVFSWT